MAAITTSRAPIIVLIHQESNAIYTNLQPYKDQEIDGFRRQIVLFHNLFGCISSLARALG